MNFITANIWRLDTVIELQSLIRFAVVDGCEASAALLDKHLSEMPDGQRLAALWIAYDLLRIMARANNEPA